MWWLQCFIVIVLALLGYDACSVIVQTFIMRTNYRLKSNAVLACNVRFNIVSRFYLQLKTIKGYHFMWKKNKINYILLITYKI